MQDTQTQLLAALRDLIQINAVVATELIQLVENSSRQLRGEIPETCRQQHGELRRRVVEIAERWGEDCRVLREHNLHHD
jgi:uncharacterized protein YcsI (UPF0317 family)